MKARNGLMFVIMYLAATSVSFSQIKIAPVLDLICASCGVTYAETSWLMSVFTIAGIVLAIPAGGLIAKYGPKKIFSLVLVVSLLGNIMGALSIANFPLLLASRIIEGSAFAMVSIAGVVFINAWFPEKQGLFNGLYTTFGAIGSALALNAVLPISQATGLVGVWWVTSAVIALFAVLFFLVVKEVKQTVPIGAGDQAPSDGGIASVLKLKSLVAIGVAQLLCGFVLYFYINNYPTVFVNVYGLDPTSANFFGSLCSLFGIPFCIVGGFVLDKLGPKRSAFLMVVCFAGMAAVCASTTFLPHFAGSYVAHALLLALFSGVLMTAEVYLVPFCVKSLGQIGLGVAIQTFGFNIGIFIGNPVVMYAVQGTGNWNIASLILCAVSAIGLLCIWVFFRSAKKEGARGFSAVKAE